MTFNKNNRLSRYKWALFTIFIAPAFIVENSFAEQTKQTTDNTVAALIKQAKDKKVYPQCNKDPLPIQKENYQKNFMSLRGLTGIYVNLDDIIKGAKKRDIVLSENLKQTIIDKLSIAGMTLLNKEEIKHIQGQPELYVYASYPKHLDKNKNGEPLEKFNRSCCRASTWTSFQQGASTLRDPDTNFKLSTWGEGHNTADCSNLTNWYQDTVVKTIDNFIKAKIKADSEYDNQQKIKRLQSSNASLNKTITKVKVVKLNNKNSNKTTCQITDAKILELFDSDESTIQKSQLPRLNQTIALMKACKNYNFIVETHSDARSEFEYNRLLSLERAETIKKYLLKNGIKQSRFNTKAFGEAKPLVKGNSEKAHITNRRVAIIPVRKTDKKNTVNYSYKN